MTLAELLGYDSRFPIYEDINIYKVQYLKQSDRVKVVLKHKVNLDEAMRENIGCVVKAKLNDLGNVDLLWYKDVEHVLSLIHI